MAGEAIMWPAASSNMTAPKLLGHEPHELHAEAARAASKKHVPQHVNVKRRPVHCQAGSLRVDAAKDALHARVQKKAGRWRLAKDDVLKICAGSEWWLAGTRKKEKS